MSGEAARGKPGRRPRLDAVPAEVREELDRRLAAGGFGGYRGLAKWLGEQGFEISASSVWRYRNTLERRLEAVKLATSEARAVAEASPDEDDRINQALIRLVQHHLFTLLIEFKPDCLSAGSLATLARSVGEIAKTAVIQKKAADDIRAAMRERLSAAERKVVGAARDAAGDKGLTPEAEAEIRRALTEIAQ